MSLSKIVVSGRIVKAPEKRFTPNNNMAVTEFVIGVESAQRQDGPVESTPVKVTTFGELAEKVAASLQKGDIVAVDGRLQMANYTDSDGQRKRQAEINAIAVENLAVSSENAPNTSTKTKQPMASVASNTSGKSTSEDLDAIFASEDEIPF